MVETLNPTATPKPRRAQPGHMFKRLYPEATQQACDAAWAAAQLLAKEKNQPEPWEFGVRVSAQHRCYWDADEDVMAAVDAAIEKEHGEAMEFWKKYQKVDVNREDLAGVEETIQ